MILRCLEGQRQRPGAVWYPALDGSSWPASAVIPVQTGRNEPGKTSVNSKCAFGIDAIRAHPRVLGAAAGTPDDEATGTRACQGIARGEECYGRVPAAARSAPCLPAATAAAFAWLSESISAEAGWLSKLAAGYPVAPGARPLAGLHRPRRVDAGHRPERTGGGADRARRVRGLLPPGIHRHPRCPPCGRCGGTGAGMTTAALAASGLLIAIGSVPYLIETVRGTAKPQVVSWAVWAALLAIGSAAALSSGQVPAAVYGGLCACVDALVAVLALRWADLALRRLDFLCLAGAVAGLVLLATVRAPAAAVAVSVGSGPDRLHPDDGPCLAEAARGDLERIRPVCRSGLAGASGRRLRRVRCRRLPGLPGGRRHRGDRHHPGPARHCAGIR